MWHWNPIGLSQKSNYFEGLTDIGMLGQHVMLQLKVVAERPHKILTDIEAKRKLTLQWKKTIKKNKIFKTKSEYELSDTDFCQKSNFSFQYELKIDIDVDCCVHIVM